MEGERDKTHIGLVCRPSRDFSHAGPADTTPAARRELEARGLSRVQDIRVLRAPHSDSRVRPYEGDVVALHPIQVCATVAEKLLGKLPLGEVNLLPSRYRRRRRRGGGKKTRQRRPPKARVRGESHLQSSTSSGLERTAEPRRALVLGCPATRVSLLPKKLAWPFPGATTCCPLVARMVVVSVGLVIRDPHPG